MSRKPSASFMRGFTLLETIVALGIILSGVAGAFGLAIQGLSSASAAKDKLLAANLAEEGIELVRHIRDNNTITDISDGVYDGSPEWNAGIGTDGDCDVDKKIDVASGVLETHDLTPLRLHAATGLYTHSAGAETPFQRVIKITRSPCPSFQTMPGVDASDQLKVRSIVSWTERGVAREVAVEEILFNWR